MSQSLPCRVGADALQSLTVRGDARGQLVALEALRDLPFAIERAYYLYGTDVTVARGFHAHRALQQFAICVAGSCRMLMDDGARRDTVALDRPDLGVHIDPMVWHEMHDFSSDCVLLVLASAPYEEADYIRDYPAFLHQCGGTPR